MRAVWERRSDCRCLMACSGLDWYSDDCPRRSNWMAHLPPREGAWRSCDHLNDLDERIKTKDGRPEGRGRRGCKAICSRRDAMVPAGSARWYGGTVSYPGQRNKVSPPDRASGTRQTHSSRPGSFIAKSGCRGGQECLLNRSERDLVRGYQDSISTSLPKAHFGASTTSSDHVASSEGGSQRDGPGPAR